MRGLALAILAIGCAHPGQRPRDPSPTLHAWSAAIARNDPHAAYQLLSSSLRARLSEADFTLRWKASPAELSAQEDALRGAPVARQASARLRDGRALPLVREGDAWRLASPHTVDEGADTPEKLLRLLVDAIDARDVDALMRLLADPLRASLEQALGDRVDKLRAAINKGGIEATGDHARIHYDSRYHIDLVQENGQWRVRDFN
jgi:hypothetical protein